MLVLFVGSIGAPLTYASDAVAGNPNFYTALYDVVSTDWNILGTQGGWIRDFLQKISTGELWAQGLSDFLVNLIIKVVIPILALAWIVLAIIGFFKLMGSTDEEELKTWWNYLLWWIVGTLIMITAAWIVIQMVGGDGTGGIIWTIVNWWREASGAELASNLYRKIAYPLIRVILNIIIGILFLMAVGQWFKYLFSGEGNEAQEKALAILVYTVVGILVIILAKTLVEATYGNYESVVQDEALLVRPWAGVDVGKVGDGVFEDPQMGMLRTVINWLLGLSTFIVTIIIVYIGYLLLVKPTDEETATKLKSAITRALAGILLIWVSYLIANFVIIK